MSIEYQEIEESRYARHDLIEWWDQRKVSAAHYIVAGAGALGNEVLKLLALIGVGRITLIDFDVVSRSNLARMVLFREDDIGQPKALVAARRLKEINPAVEVTPIVGDLRIDLGLGDYRYANLVFGCLDSVSARWALNRRCLQAGVGWVDGGISDYHGLVAHYSSSGGACYECTFTERTVQRFNRRYSCPFGLVSSEEEPKVPTTAVTTSMIAAMQVQQAMLMLHDAPEALEPGQRVMVYLKPFQMVRDALPRNETCLAHDSLTGEIPALPSSYSQTSEQVIKRVRQIHPEVDRFDLPFEWVSQFFCECCNTATLVQRPKEKVQQHEATCPSCKQLRRPEMIQSVGVVSEQAGLTINQLGIPEREIIAFRAGEETFYFQINA